MLVAVARAAARWPPSRPDISTAESPRKSAARRVDRRWPEAIVPRYTGRTEQP
jgi:hypothetical protein